MQWIITLIGVIGLGTLTEWVRRGQTLNRAQAFYRWRYREPLDIVITTADCTTRDDVNSGKLDRLHGQLGYIQAATMFTEGISRSRARKPIEIHLSDGISHPLSNDLVLLGGTSGNHFAKRFLDYISASTGTRIVFDETDETHNRIELGPIIVDYDWIKASQDSTKFTDFALVVLWINPFAMKRNRAIYCAGFTSAGTRAAARYLVENFPRRWRPHRNREGSIGRFKRSWQSFAMILAVEFRNDHDFDVTEVSFVRLPLPKIPLSCGPQTTNAYWRLADTPTHDSISNLPNATIVTGVQISDRIAPRHGRDS